MNLKQLILVILSMVSLSLFAQDTYYYYCGQRIPLTTDPTRVNVITLSSYSTQGGAAFMPAAVPSGIQVETVISGSIYNMSLLMTSVANVDLLNNYVNSTVNPNYNIALPCYKDSFKKKLTTTHNLYIKLKEADDSDLLQMFITRYNLRYISQNKYMPLWHTVSITPQTPYKTVELANILYETGAFQSVEPEFLFDASESISWDKNVSQQWGLYNASTDSIDINASSAWNYATGRGVKVAVIDTGVEHTHDDLTNNISSLYCDIDTTTGVLLKRRSVYDSHGTHVAGIIAAERNNGEFIAGVAPDAEIMAVSLRIQKSKATNFADAINWSWHNGADVINCSWSSSKSELITNALDSAMSIGRNGLGCIIVAASGNSNMDSVVYPACCNSKILVVGAIHKGGDRVSLNDTTGSCYGKALDIVAPGQDIYSLNLNNSACLSTGTSMGTAFVSGVVALILELDPTLKLQDVTNIIERNTIKVGVIPYDKDVVNRPNGSWLEFYGYGLVDALKAVQNTRRKQIDY